MAGASVVWDSIGFGETPVREAVFANTAAAAAPRCLLVTYDRAPAAAAASGAFELARVVALPNSWTPRQRYYVYRRVAAPAAAPGGAAPPPPPPGAAATPPPPAPPPADGGPAPWVPERALAAVARAHRSARFGDGATEASAARPPRPRASRSARAPRRARRARRPRRADMAQFMGGLNSEHAALGTSNVQQFL